MRYQDSERKLIYKSKLVLNIHKIIDMQNVRYFISLCSILFFNSTYGQNTTPVNHFDKVIISPHIQVTLVQGNEQSVTIENTTVSKDKIKIEINNTTLWVYLEGAKE